ncbi:MAG: hypothetical protein WC554_04085 [Clostridia bacterium]|jgi:hypothetical protein
MAGIGPSRNRQKTEGIAQYGEPGQPALPDIIPYPASDTYTPYDVYNARDYSVMKRPIRSQISLSPANKSTLLFGLVIGIPLALIIWRGLKKSGR